MVPTWARSTEVNQRQVTVSIGIQPIRWSGFAPAKFEKISPRKASSGTRRLRIARGDKHSVKTRRTEGERRDKKIWPANHRAIDIHGGI